MNTRIEKYFIITRDTEDLTEKIKMRQCWTGRNWSRAIDNVLVYDSYAWALSEQMDLNFHHSTGKDIPPPGFALYPADIRKISKDDIKPGWKVPACTRAQQRSSTSSPEF